MSNGEFIQVEITGFASCKSLNPYRKERKWHYVRAEKFRKEYKIKSVIIDGQEVICDEGYSRDEDVFLESFPIGSIQTAQIIGKNNVRIDNESNNSGK